MYTFLDLQNEVKRRATRDQGGTQFDTAIKNVINASLFRICREAHWRQLRRKDTFSTVTSYDKGSGSGSFTNDSTTVNVTSASFLTDEVKIGRRVKLSGDSTYHTIKTITSETAFTIEEGYNGTSTNSGTYEILPQEEYVLPVQATHRVFLWHEEWGFPYPLRFVSEQAFRNLTVHNTTENVPSHYRMWGEDMVRSQPLAPSIVSVESSVTTDTSISVIVFGTVEGYPDQETIVTNAVDATNKTAGNKTFSNIDRVVKASSSKGRITVTSDSANNTVAVIPVGDTTAGIMYSKIQMWPLPSTVFEVQVQYYKDPYRLVNDTDVHELGQDFDEAIVLLSVAKIKYESDQKEGDRWLALYQDEIRNLRKINADKIDWFPTLKRPFLSRGLFGDDFVHRNLLYRQVGSYYGPQYYR